MEGTSVVGAIDTTGSVTIGSGAITLAADVTTTGKQDYQGNVGLVGTRTLAAGAGAVTFGSTVDASPALFADPDAFAAGSALTNSFPGITLSAVGTGDTGVVVKSGNSGVSTPTTGDYAPTGSRIFAGLNKDWNAPVNIFKAAFSSTVTSVSLDFAPNDESDRNAYFDAYDAVGNKVASATYPPAIPELSFVALTVSAPNIAYVLASFDPSGVNTGLLDNLRATLATTPAAALTVNSAGTTTFAGVVGGTAALASLTTDAGGTSTLQSVTTTGTQTYNDDTVTLSGAYTTTNSAFTVDKATALAGNTTVGTGVGTVDFKGAVDGAQTLSLTAGTGNVTFGGLVGNTTPLGAITIISAMNMTANGIRAASLTQVAGSGTTTLNGGTFTSAPAGSEAVRTSGAAGVSLTGTNLAVHAAIMTSNGGVVTFNESGTITIASAGEILADSAVSMTATDGITTAGDVTTTNDNVTFASTTTLSGPVVIDTGVGAGNVLFSGTLDGAQTLDLTAGTGTISFGSKVGNAAPLAGLLLRSGASTTFASTLNLVGSVEGASSYGLSIFGGVDNVTLNTAGSSITNFDGDGIVFGGFAGGSKNTTISGVTISNNGDNGINVISGGDYTGSAIRDNTITGNGQCGILLRPAGAPLITNLTIGGDKTAAPSVGNRIYSNTSDGILVDAGTYTGTVIQGNQVGSLPTPFSLVGGSPQVTLAGDQTDEFQTGQVVALQPSAPAAGAWVVRRITAVTIVGGNTLVTLSAPIDATTTVGNLVAGNLANGISLDANGGAITELTIGGSLNEANSIQASGLSGIQVSFGDYAGTVIDGNAIGVNGSHGIHLLSGGGSTSVGRLVITAPGLSGSPLTGNSAAELQLPQNPQSSTIQAIAAAGYPTVMPSLQSLGATVAGTPPTTLQGSGIGGVANPGAAYQAAAQTAFETNPALPTNGFPGVAVYDSATSGTLPASPPAATPQDGFLFYDFIVAAGGVAGLSITGNTIASNLAAGIRADEAGHFGTTVQGNTLEGNRFGMALVGARNLAIGGTDAGQGNTIVGGGNAGSGQHRDGIYATGILAGTSVVGTSITNAACGLVLDSAQSLTIDQVGVTNAQSHALWAKGTLAGTVLDGFVASRTTAVATGVSAVLMNAQGLTVRNADVSGNGWGAYVFGTSTGTTIVDSTLVGMSVGLNAYTATGLTLEATTANGSSYGLVTTGSLTGTRFLTSAFTAAGGGAAAGVYRTTGATFQENSFGATGTTFGVYATGASAGTTFISNTLAGNVVGLRLAAATGLEFGRVGAGNTISGSTFAGLEASGACTGSVVLATSWSTNVVNVINNATGLTVNPA